jgi:hypothetical protein
MEVGAVVGIGHAASAPVRVEQRVDRSQTGDQQTPERTDVAETLLVE